MKIKFLYILIFAAVLLSGAAAFYSITGLSQLFGGSKLAVIIMASGLEIAKLVTASFVYRYWNTISKLLKIYMVSGVIILMSLTSLGIYGFLSNAYQKTSSEISVITSEIEVINNKKSFYLNDNSNKSDQIELKNTRIKSLTDLRIQQEIRLDSLYAKGWIAAAKRTEKIIEEANNNINKISAEVDNLNKGIYANQDSINKLDIKILELQNNTKSSDIGPLIYISKITGYSMDNVVNVLILLIVFVFDPLAVLMFIAINIILKDETNKKLSEVDNLNKTIVTPEPVFEKNVEEKSRFEPPEGSIIPTGSLTSENKSAPDVEVIQPIEAIKTTQSHHIEKIKKPTYSDGRQ